MTYTVNCPTCKNSLRIRDEQAGARLACPLCATEFEPPRAATAIQEAVPAAAPAAAPGRTCPECGQPIRSGARKCPHCRAWLDDEAGPAEAPPSKYVPCPRCKASGAERVTWTAWGSFYGPLLFTHVRCLGCGYKYNGKTGRSNLIPAIFFVLVPLLGIVAVLAGLASWLYYNGVFGQRY